MRKLISILAVFAGLGAGLAATGPAHAETAKGLEISAPIRVILSPTLEPADQGFDGWVEITAGRACKVLGHSGGAEFGLQWVGPIADGKDVYDIRQRRVMPAYTFTTQDGRAMATHAILGLTCTDGETRVSYDFSSH